jgi:hypothetical protein
VVKQSAKKAANGDDNVEEKEEEYLNSDFYTDFVVREIVPLRTDRSCRSLPPPFRILLQ